MKNIPTRPESAVIIARILRLESAARQYDNSFVTTASAELTPEPAVDVDALVSDVEGDEGASSDLAMAKRQKSLCPPFILCLFLSGLVLCLFVSGLVLCLFVSGLVFDCSLCRVGGGYAEEFWQ